MSEANVSDLFSRNAPLITEAAQARLSELRVGLVGCGLASQIALSLARVGIRHMRLWDFDRVEPSNLNRQAFFSDSVGQNKAMATLDLLYQLDPKIDVEARPGHFTLDDLRSSARLDVVVNSADFDDPLVYDLSDAVQASGSWCIQPLNIGFGGSCVLLGPSSPSLAELTDGRQSTDSSFILALLRSCVGFAPSKALAESGPSLLAASEQIGFFPQNVVATLITTALATWSVVMIASGSGASIQAPRILHFEPQT